MNPLLILPILVAYRTPPTKRVLFYGEGYLFRIELPERWQAKEGERIVATLWPDGAKQEDAEAAITIRSDPKPASRKGSFESAIDKVLASMKEEAAGSKVVPGPTLESLLGQKAFTFFVEPADGVRRCVAFYDTPKVAISFTLKAKTPEAYNAALAAYVPLVKSFGFVTDKIRKKPPEGK